MSSSARGRNPQSFRHRHRTRGPPRNYRSDRAQSARRPRRRPQARNRYPTSSQALVTRRFRVERARLQSLKAARESEGMSTEEVDAKLSELDARRRENRNKKRKKKSAPNSSETNLQFTSRLLTHSGKSVLARAYAAHVDKTEKHREVRKRRRVRAKQRREREKIVVKMRNRKGQPVMKFGMERLLAKIVRQSERRNGSN